MRYLLRRLLLTVPTLLGVAVAVFVTLRLVPGDPASMMVVPEATAEDIAKMKQAYGLDKSVPEQFVLFIGGLLRGDLGTSISLKQSVAELVLGRLPATLELAMVAITISVVAGLLLALAAIHWRGTFIESAVDAVNSVSLAVPEFLWALLLILLFGVALPILPISGRLDPTQTYALSTQFYVTESLLRGRFHDALGLLQFLLLPALALSLPLTAVIARVLKSSLVEVLVQDYILLARVKGFGPWHVLLRQALPNALLPTLSITGVHFVFLVGGTVLVELIFSYPGVGNMLYGAAINRDLPLIQGVTLVFAVVFVLMNLAIDLLYSLVNVRIRND